MPMRAAGELESAEQNRADSGDGKNLAQALRIAALRAGAEDAEIEGHIEALEVTPRPFLSSGSCLRCPL